MAGLTRAAVFRAAARTFWRGSRTTQEPDHPILTEGDDPILTETQIALTTET